MVRRARHRDLEGGRDSLLPLPRVEPVTLTPIGRVAGGRTEVRDDDWGGVTAAIRFDAQQFGTEALAGLEARSRTSRSCNLHRVARDAVERATRAATWRWPRVGIFAQRGGPPAGSGSRAASCSGSTGSRSPCGDAVDGSPVLDVKPYMRRVRAPRSDPAARLGDR